MGASKSTGRSNGTENEEDKQRQQKSSGVSTGAATAIAVAAVAGAAWGISRMLSDDPETKEKDDATAIAVAAVAGAAVAAWGISRMLSDDPETKEKDDAMTLDALGTERSLPNPKIRGHIGYGTDMQPTIGFPPRPNRIGYHDSDFTLEGANNKQSGMWQPPSPGRFKMNTDGISRPNPGPSAYAGILRNDRGEWVRGFVGFLGDAEIHTAEIYGIYHGVRLLIKLKKQGSILESDSQEAVCWTTKKNKSYEDPTTKMAHCSDIINECWRLADKNNIRIEKINGDDANQCADKLAKLALRLRKEYLEIKEIPDKIKNLVDKESLKCV